MPRLTADEIYSPSEIYSLESYLRKWQLSEPVFMAKTPSSHLYRVQRQGAAAVLKVLTPLGRKCEAQGAIALRCFAGHGSIRLLDADDGAHLLPFIAGPHLRDVASDVGDQRVTEIICDVLDQMHGYPGPMPAALPSMRENFRALFQRIEQEPGDELCVAAAQVALRLIESARDVVLLHGDIHHKNIMECPVAGWLALDPQCLVGERLYDCANVFYNPDDAPALVESSERIEALSLIFAARLNSDRRRVLEYAFAFGCLSACWAREDGLSPNRRLRIAEMIYSHTKE